MNCPVCNQPIDADDIKCPHCGADIKALDVNKLKKESSQKSRTILLISIIAIIVICVLIILLINNPNKKKARELEIANKELTIKDSLLNDSITRLNKVLDSLKNQLNNPYTRFTKFGDKYKEYKIQKGDVLWTISNHFYGSPMYYDKIAADNNIENPDFIIIGQKIKIFKK
jgi:nucleoid-associated protein YgaU